MELEGSSVSLIEVVLQHLPGETENGHMKSVVVSNVLDEIKTENLPITSPVSFLYTTLLAK
jgi:hypothetical protein